MFKISTKYGYLTSNLIFSKKKSQASERDVKKVFCKQISGPNCLSKTVWLSIWVPGKLLHPFVHETNLTTTQREVYNKLSNVSSSSR
jgi:hypothetical protein